MSVPRMSHMPLLVAKTTMGARELSRALLFRGGRVSNPIWVGELRKSGEGR